MAEKSIKLDQVKQALAAVKPYLEKAKPFVCKAHDFYVQYQPLAKEQYARVAPFVNWELVLALIMLFFGSQFALCICAYRAFEMSGGPLIRKSLKELGDSYREGIVALRKDSELVGMLDRDGDGDVSPQEVFVTMWEFSTAKKEEDKEKRLKLLLGMLKCIDPQRFLDAAGGFWAGTTAVLATLRSQVARYVTIGANLGTKLGAIAQAKTATALTERYPQYTRWIDAGYRALGAFLGIALAFLLTRMVIGLSVALSGARVASNFALDFALKREFLKTDQVAQMRDFAVYGLAGIGFLFQYHYSFSVPWFMQLFLFPFMMIESVLGILAVV